MTHALTVLDTYINLQYRVDKLKIFTNKSLRIIKSDYGVPEPFDKAVFALFFFVTMIVLQKLLSGIFTKEKSASNS